MPLSDNIRSVVEKVTVTLPPAMLGLLCINTVFILGMLWFMHDIQIERISAIKSIFETCTAAINKLPIVPTSHQ